MIDLPSLMLLRRDLRETQGFDLDANRERFLHWMVTAGTNEYRAIITIAAMNRARLFLFAAMALPLLAGCLDDTRAPDPSGVTDSPVRCIDASTLPRTSAASVTASSDTAGATFRATWSRPGVIDDAGNMCIATPGAELDAAIQAATDIWAVRIASSVPIRIELCWTDFRKNTELPEAMRAGATGIALGYRTYRNFEHAPQRDVCYPKPLANALAGYDLEPAFPDMQISYNAGLANPPTISETSALHWYFGADGNPPADGYGRMDLVHVVAHEIAHGLGFRGSMDYDVDTGIGQWGADGYPLIYDTFIVDRSCVPGQRRLLDYPQRSTALGQQLIGDSLYFAGANAIAANQRKCSSEGSDSSAPVKINAPVMWMPGSSYSHLDFATYNPTPDQLMVHEFFFEPMKNEPGPVIIGILRDLGWKMR
mgnify:CR=1 FL=1